MAVALELGTVSECQTLEALRADNWPRAHGDPQSLAASSIQALIHSAFYVDDDLWRGMAPGQSLAACRQALAGLAS